MGTNFLLYIFIAQQGPETIRAFLKNIENTSIKSSDEEVDAAFLRAAKEHIDQVRQKLNGALEIWENPQASYKKQAVHG